VNEATIFGAVALVILLLGTIAIARVDVRTLAGPARSGAPSRTARFARSRMFLPAACLSGLAGVSAIGAIGFHVTMAKVQEEARASDATIVASQTTDVPIPPPVVAGGDPGVLTHLRVASMRPPFFPHRPRNAGNPSEADVRNACLSLMQNAANWLTNDPAAHLDQTQSSRIQYCLVKLSAEVRSPPEPPPRKVPTEAVPALAN
jgi:hypothetical protein